MLMTGDKPIEVFGWPSPNFADFDGDGDLDLLCGEFLDGFTYFENCGSRTEPDYATGIRVKTSDGQPLVMDLQMITPTAIDWDKDGDFDLIVGDEDGRVAFVENTGRLSDQRVPQFFPPKYFRQEADKLKFGALATPCGFDWDGDGLPDLMVNSILGKVIWYRNVGSRKRPKLAAPKPIEVEWKQPQPELSYGWLRPEGNNLLTQWRTTPVAIDWNKDGLTDLIMLDHEGYLAFFERVKRDGELIVLPPRRVFCDEAGQPLQLNSRLAGKSGRRKLCIVDWDGDGALDILANSENATMLRQVDQIDGKWIFKDLGLLSTHKISGHTTSPTVIDLDNNHVPDLLVGAEDGLFYFMKNERSSK
jgi:hypothetical protein